VGSPLPTVKTDDESGIDTSQDEELCEFYDKKTHRCKEDGSAICCFPRSQQCDIADDARPKTHGVPSIILEIMRKQGKTTFPEQVS
jgi:hypothetical protein